MRFWNGTAPALGAMESGDRRLRAGEAEEVADVFLKHETSDLLGDAAHRVGLLEVALLLKLGVQFTQCMSHLRVHEIPVFSVVIL